VEGTDRKGAFFNQHPDWLNSKDASYDARTLRTRGSVLWWLRTKTEAIKLANDFRLRLWGSVFTSNPERACAIAESETPDMCSYTSRQTLS